MIKDGVEGVWHVNYGVRRGLGMIKDGDEWGGHVKDGGEGVGKIKDGCEGVQHAKDKVRRDWA